MNNYHKATLNKKKTGQNIRKAILNSGMTFEQVATSLNLSSSRVIYEWMAGRKLPNLENLMNLVLMLSIKMEDVIVIQ